MTNKKKLLTIMLVPIVFTGIFAIFLTYLFSQHHLKNEFRKDFYITITHDSEKVYEKIKNSYRDIFNSSAMEPVKFFVLKEALKTDIKRDLNTYLSNTNYFGFIYDRTINKRFILKSGVLDNIKIKSLNTSTPFSKYSKGEEFIGKKIYFKPFDWDIVLYSDTRIIEHEIEDSLRFILFYTVLLLIVIFSIVKYTYELFIKRDITLILDHFENKLKLNKYEQIDIELSSYEMNSFKDGINSTINEIHNYQNKLNSLNETLEIEVDTKTLQLKAANQKLKDMNKDLENKVDKAIQDIREKDNILIQQSKMASMGEMIGNIAHQWRQPLNALSLTIQKIKMYHEEDLLTSEQLNKSIDKSKMLITKMSTTIDDFRNFFKTDKSKSKFKILDVIKDSLEIIGASLKSHNIAVELKSINHISIYGFKNELEQALLNILNNAKDVLIERKIDNPLITIEVKDNDLNISIMIYDNAGGIDEEIINDIFNPYFTTKDQGQGTGIGLYMSQMIIQNNMHGNIKVNNTQEGACFTIELKKELVDV